VIGAVLQLVVPVAAPDPPVELLHVTLATPTLSLAVPLTTIEPADVEIVELAGETIVKDGGVVSGAPGGAGNGGVGGFGDGAEACWRVTVTVWVT